ncbi:MAG: DJ-1/PfpI family protein [bacterium]
MDLSGKKILMVIAPENFRDTEYFEPKKALEEYAVQVRVASTQIGQAHGADEGVVQIDLTLTEVNVNDYDGVVFVGGPGMVEMVEHQGLIQLAQNFYQAGKLVAGICVAAAILAKAGILTGKRATCWGGAKNYLVQGGAIYTGASVEVDGKIITANGPPAAHEFGHKIAEALSS